MRVPETKYARSADGLRLAYQEWGEGPRVLVVPGLLSNVELMWEHSNTRPPRFLDRFLGSTSRRARRCGHQRRNLLGGFGLHPRYRMLILPHRELRRGVTEPLRHDLRRHART